MQEISRLIIGQPQAYLSDPHLWIDSRAGLSIRFALYESLVKYNQQGKIVPGLASTWKLEQDCRTWLFKLRPGVKFHNGDPLTAEDAAASIRRAVRPEMPGEYGTAALLAGYLKDARIEALDGETLRIVTSEPIADLLDLLIYAVVIPAHCANGVADAAPGTGPYQIKQATVGEVVVERFMDYWAGPAPVETLVFRGIGEALDRALAFNHGEVDIITYMPLELRQSFLGNPDAQMIERMTPLCVIFMLNAFRGPCADRRVRQALNYATDIPEVIQTVMHGNAVRINGPLSRHHTGTDPDLAPYPYDPEKSRQLLKEAGFVDNLTLTLDRPVISPDESAELAAVLRDQWSRVGITLLENVHENREQYSLTVRSKQIADMCVFDSSPFSTYRILREKLHSGFAGPWWEGYQNLRVNALMEEAWSTVDETRRIQLYREAYRLIHEDAPWLFLYSTMDMWVVRKGISETLPGWGAGVDGLVMFGQG